MFIAILLKDMLRYAVSLKIDDFIIGDMFALSENKDTYDDNIRSKRLCERLGMRREGCFKEFVTFINNSDESLKYEDTCVYAILKKEWNVIRQW